MIKGPPIFLVFPGASIPEYFSAGELKFMTIPFAAMISKATGNFGKLNALFFEEYPG